MKNEINSIVKDFISNLSSSDDLTRVRARHALVAIGEPALPALVEALDNPDNLERWEVAKAIGEIGTSEAAPALVRALEDEEFEVRWCAAEGLIRMNVQGLKPLFQALMERADSVSLRQGAHHVLHDLAKGELKRHLALVLKALEGKVPAVQVPIVVSHAMEQIERIQKTADRTNSSLFETSTAVMPDRVALDLHPRGRIRRYIETLRNS